MFLNSGALYQQFHNQGYLLLCSAEAVANKAEFLFCGQGPQRGSQTHEHPWCDDGPASQSGSAVNPRRQEEARNG